VNNNQHSYSSDEDVNKDNVMTPSHTESIALKEVNDKEPSDDDTEECSTDNENDEDDELTLFAFFHQDALCSTPDKLLDSTRQPVYS